MGAGCSSPLRRFGGKRGKPTQRDSVSIEVYGNQEQLTIASKLQSEQQQEHQQQPQQQKQPKEQHSVDQRLVLENEITVQSEIDDHPSTASYYTDGKNQYEDAQQKPAGDDPSEARPAVSQLIGAGAAAARVMGLSGTYVPHDRHLLVSPALSPAPSICQSPLVNGVPYAGSPTTALDLYDLNVAFKALTFGSADNQLKHRIKLPERTLSEIHQYYSQQLVQSQNDLSNHISVLFFATDHSFNSSSSGDSEKIQLNSNTINLLASQIESNIKALCDESSFNLKFLNLSQNHLSKSMHVNNLADVAMKIFEQEYQDNSRRLIIIALANNPNNLSCGSNEVPLSEEGKQQIPDNRLLPTKIDAHLFTKLIDLLNSDSKALLKKWYHQVGPYYYLSPIYMVEPRILDESKDEHERAWTVWLNDQALLLKALAEPLESHPDLASSLKMRSLFASYIDHIMSETALQKRTLLIRNYPSITGNQASNQPQSLQLVAANRLGSLTELARLLADPNKFTLKRSLGEDEFVKTVNEWISENISKYLESFTENRILQGRYIPSFIERNLFIELSRQRHHLEFYLDNTTESFEDKCSSFYSSQIQPLLSAFFDDSNLDATTGANTTASRQSLNSQQSTSHLVLISGPRGCGKTTLFAQLIKNMAQELSTKAQIIYRFCGLTMDSINPNRLLRSICEQFCQTQGENITAASYIYSSRSEVMSSLNKIIKQQNSIILLDGLDDIQNTPEIGLDWLCDIEASPRIKMIIMLETDSPLYNRVLSTYSDATFISLDNPSLNEWAQMLTSTARAQRFNSLGNLYDDIKNSHSKDSTATTMTYSYVSDILHMCRVRQLNNEHSYPELTNKLIITSDDQATKEVHQLVLRHVHYLLNPHKLCFLIAAISSSRYGLSETDLVNIMNLISKQLGKDTDSVSAKFSSSHLSYLKIQLQPWLRYIFCDKTVKLTLQKDFMRKALDYYIPSLYPKVIEEVREILLDYFNRPLRQQRASKGFLSGSGDILHPEHKERLTEVECLWLGTQASEVINLLILTNPSKAKDYLMNKQQFFLQFLHRSAPEEFIEDYDRLKAITGRKLSQNEELQHLVNYIRQSIFSLRYDGSQIYSQIFCRAYEHHKTGKFSKSKKFNDILTISSCPPIKNLLPASELSIESFIRTRIGLNQPPTSSISTASSLSALANQKTFSSNNSNQAFRSTGMGSNAQPNQQQQSSRQRIFTIKDNHRHVIVACPDKNCLFVWDIYEERAVRTITNIDQPRDLRMIDQKRAVILCNRELRVYDLDSGSLLKKLKGVMNQKMPYFEVFGEDYVVALARNRMYVNMLNLSTGELETTFKVGEDRFLNSLLVSANGGVCVCGDETQKPFPLLVWNLNERRLMYDLRLDRHEFVTRMSAISDDGHYVVSVCKQVEDSLDGPANSNATGSTSTATTSSFLSCKSTPNFIVIYDLNSGTLFKKWKPGLDTCGVAISISANRSSKVINSMVDSTILVWDLATGSRRHILHGHSAPPDVIQVQNGRLFSMDSTCRDQSLRIWNIDEGYCLAVFSPDAPVSCCQISTRGDALVCGFTAETRLSTLLLCKNETVSDVIKRNKRRKSSKTLYVFDEIPNRKPSS